MTASRIVVPLARAGLVAWVGVIIWSSLAPPEDLPYPAQLSDKLLHVLAYAAFGALGALATRPPRPVVVTLAALAFGLLLEVLQFIVGYRAFELLDLVADVLGAATGALLVTVLVQMWPSPPERDTLDG